MSKTILVRLHARAAELAGLRETTVELPQDARGADLKGELARRHPPLAPLLDSCALATEEEFLADGAEVGNPAALHLIPPVSGG